MAEKHSKRPRDLHQWAKGMVDILINRSRQMQAE